MYKDKELSDVKAFQERFALREPVTQSLLWQRCDFIGEELKELQEAIHAKDMAEVFDALLDIVYVVKGTAALMDLPWELGWTEVHRSNMDKVPGGISHRLNRDMLKPEGWVGPRLEPLVKQLELDL